MAHLKVVKLQGRHGTAKSICSGSYIFGLNGNRRAARDPYGISFPLTPDEMLKAIKKCANRRALMIVGFEQQAAKRALRTLVARRAITLRRYPWSDSASLVVAKAA